jgi:GNAT superfamily N-acetyltransferase
LDFKRLGDLDAAQMDALRALYEEAFPPSERVAFEELVEAEDDASRVQIAMLEAGEPLGLSISARLPINWWFVEYLAITRDRRSRGLGSQLWGETLRWYAADDACDGAVLEVEPPDSADVDPLERFTRQRRIAFYERHGFRQLDVPRYRAPRLDGDGTVDFLLLALVEGELPTGDSLRNLARSLLTNGYGLAPDDPLVAEVGEGVPD